MRLFSLCLMVGAALAGAATGPRAQAGEAELWQALQAADQVLARAIANPQVLRTDVGPALLRVRAHLPHQRYQVIEYGTREYVGRCLEQDPWTGAVRSPHAAFVPLGSCITRINPANVLGSIASCEVVFCPRAMATSPEWLVHAVIHEVAHTAGFVNECQATYVAMMAQRLAGIPAETDVYVGGCGLAWLAGGGEGARGDDGSDPNDSQGENR